MAFTVYEIPTSTTPQAFQIALAGVTYNLVLKWNLQNGSWMIDIADADNNPLVNGIPLITGADLLAQYAYLGIGGQLRVQTDTDVDAVPTAENLGTHGHLYFVTSP